MRSRHLSFMAGWVAIALLALAGFAAFANPGPSSQQIQVEAAAASMGHTSGAYAGFAFASRGSEQPSFSTASAETGTETVAELTQTSEAAAEEDDSSSGTIADPDTGWLSEVEVRALITLYFKPEDVNRAVRVAWCESRFDPTAVNMRTGGIGLFQHLPRYWDERADAAGFPGVDPTDPEASVAAAAWAVYEGGGWDIFTCGG